MSDDNAYNKNYYRRVAEELAEADEPRNRAQAQLDHWWQAQREIVRLLYVATRHQRDALTAVLELEGLE